MLLFTVYFPNYIFTFSAINERMDFEKVIFQFVLLNIFRATNLTLKFHIQMDSFNMSPQTFSPSKQLETI